MKKQGKNNIKHGRDAENAEVSVNDNNKDDITNKVGGANAVSCGKNGGTDDAALSGSENNGAVSGGAGSCVDGQQDADGRQGAGAPEETVIALDELFSVISELQKKLSEAEEQSQKHLDRWQRSAAEFENYKRRAIADMDRRYLTGAAEAIAAFLPVVDSVERAIGVDSPRVERAVGVDSTRVDRTVGADSTRVGETEPESGGGASADPYREGLLLIKRQITDVMNKLDVKPLPGAGEQFDPNLHEAVMHVDDGAYGANTIVEVFRQGYIYKDRIVRHSVVKVAN